MTGFEEGEALDYPGAFVICRDDFQVHVFMFSTTPSFAHLTLLFARNSKDMYQIVKHTCRDKALQYINVKSLLACC